MLFSSSNEQLNESKIPAHHTGHVNVPGAFHLSHLFILSLVTHFHLRCKSIVFKTIAGNTLTCKIFSLISPDAKRLWSAEPEGLAPALRE